MPTPGEQLLSALGWSGERPARVLVFVAHPDDETIGLGGHLGDFVSPLVVHATDGAPRDLMDARARGFGSADAYAQARRDELRAAMRLVDLEEGALVNLGFADQQAARNLTPLTRAFVARLQDYKPDFVFTHAYEGGHPDHDAVAFAAHAALSAAPGPRLIEMPLYHGENGAFVRSRFSPAPPSPAAITVELDAQARERKRRMIAAFATQRATLTPFPDDRESFRPAPAYDFLQLPNGGEILYEAFDWGCKGADCLAFVKASLAALDLPSCL